MKFKFIALLSTTLAVAQEMPYSPVAISTGDHPDRRVADSLNVQIGTIRVNQAGYLPSDPNKLFYVVGDATAFDVVLASDSSVVTSGSLVATGKTTESSIKIVADSNHTTNNAVIYTFAGTGPSGNLQKGILPSGLPEETPLRIRVGSDYSADFIISPKVYTYVRNATMRFFGLQQSKHLKDGMGSIVGGTVGAAMVPQEGKLAGGWYDCGDHLKESQTQAYAAAMLALSAAIHQNKDQDQYDAAQSNPLQTDGVPDMLAEARHGAEFVLAAYDMAHGVIDDMPLSVGNFGDDHGFWGLPSMQEALDAAVTGKGGPLERDVRVGELGSNISSQFAANLAIVSKLYEGRDATFAAKCLQVSKELYAFAKGLALGTLQTVNNQDPSGWSTSAYNGNNEHHDDLALAAIALLYATADTSYLYDAVENPALAGTQTKSFFNWSKNGAGAFRGGWFAHKEASLVKNVKNASWSNIYAPTLYAFYKLMLEKESDALRFGISNSRRLQYIEDVLLTMAANLGDVASGTDVSLQLPQGALMWKFSKVQANLPWYNMNTDQTWIFNRYQSGNIFEVLAYADAAANASSLSLPNTSGSDWKASEMHDLGLRQMDYLLGLNPWDLSMIYGIGDKNDMHPHHRQANPEGRNPLPGLYEIPEYPYTVPVGALYGGAAPISSNALTPAYSSWEDYHYSETCLDGASTLLASLAILSDGSLIPTNTSPAVKSVPASEILLAQQVGSELRVGAQLQGAQSVHLRIYALDGRMLQSHTWQGVSGQNQWTVDLRTLPSAMSVVKIQSGAKAQIRLIHPASN